MTNIQTSYFMLGLFSGCLLSILALVLVFKITGKFKSIEPAEKPASLAEMQENYTLLLKTSRRCARDLRHATDLLDRKKIGDEVKDSFYARYQHYETVLGGTNDYRLELYRTVEMLKDEVDEWKAIANEKPT